MSEINPITFTPDGSLDYLPLIQPRIKLMAAEITIDNVKRAVNTIDMVVNWSPTAKDDAVWAKVKPVVSRVMANNEFQALLYFVNKLSSKVFGSAGDEAAAIPEGYDQEAFTALAEMVIEDARRQAA